MAAEFDQAGGSTGGPTPQGAAVLVVPVADIEVFFSGSKYAKYGRFIFAALGVVPWIGGLIGAGAALHAENEQGKTNASVRRWLEEHERKLADLKRTLGQIMEHLEDSGVEERLRDERYLELVRQGFRAWDTANAQEKREYVRRALTHAGSTRDGSDDVARLFLQWIDHYDETHFQVMRAVYQRPGATRAAIWKAINGAAVREDSAEADLFRLLVRDLSTGGVVRQERETNHAGQFVRKSPPRRTKVFVSATAESAFEDTKPYVLTALGAQFVHYALGETALRGPLSAREPTF